MTSSQPEQRTYIQYRAVCFDRPTEVEPPTRDVGKPRPLRSEAENDLADMMHEANPPFDEGWVELRTVSEWRRS